MNDIEFDVLDELYFISGFDALCEQCDYTEEEVKAVLLLLLKKKFVKVFRTPDEELPFDKNDFEQNYRKYLYLATKAGLKAHNGC